MHDHCHHHASNQSAEQRSRNRWRLTLTLVLTGLYMFAEAIGGWLSDSLALLADAGHMFSDAAALGLSLFAIWIAQRPPTPQHSYGYYRAEILAALANGATLVGISLFICIEAIGRLSSPHVVFGPVMIGVAVGGLFVNLAGLVILHGGRDDSLNVRGAWLHLLTDALGSVAALGAGALIWGFGWNWADPVASILIGLLVIYSSWSLLRDAINILMERTPPHISIDEVREAMLMLPGVCGVHDLHVWTITGGMESLSAHVTLAGGHPPRLALEAIGELLRREFHIEHSTIQLEPDDEADCRTSFEAKNT
jgi:cobalt-zinc-cadmium efflux system protein